MLCKRIMMQTQANGIAVDIKLTFLKMTYCFNVLLPVIYPVRGMSGNRCIC
jgi:hypothetical protein